jgi:hypothetical protein
MTANDIDLGRFMNGANRTVEDLKSELTSGEVEEAKRAIEEIKKTEIVSGDAGRDARPRKPRLRKL